MTNNVTKKKDIMTSFILSDVFNEEEYPVDLVDQRMKPKKQTLIKVSTNIY
jgi:hypothetical protein